MQLALPSGMKAQCTRRQEWSSLARGRDAAPAPVSGRAVLTSRAPWSAAEPQHGSPACGQRQRSRRLRGTPSCDLGSLPSPPAASGLEAGRSDPRGDGEAATRTARRPATTAPPSAVAMHSVGRRQDHVDVRADCGRRVLVKGTEDAARTCQGAAGLAATKRAPPPATAPAVRGSAWPRPPSHTCACGAIQEREDSKRRRWSLGLPSGRPGRAAGG